MFYLVLILLVPLVPCLLYCFLLNRVRNVLAALFGIEKKRKKEPRSFRGLAQEEQSEYYQWR